VTSAASFDAVTMRFHRNTALTDVTTAIQRDTITGSSAATGPARRR
jgi:hypothetical protein